MINLLELGAKDNINHHVGGEFAVRFNCIGPDGVRHIVDLNGKPLAGFIRWTHADLNTDTGEQVVVPTPVIWFPRSILEKVPATGQEWMFQIPSGPMEKEPSVWFAMDTASAVTGSRTQDLIRIVLVKAEQAA